MKLCDLEEGKLKITFGMTVKNWCKECIGKYKTNLSAASLSRYENRMNHWIVDKIGDMKLKDVKPLHCQAVINQLDGYSQFQINAISQMLKFIFDKSIENELLVKNPAANLTKLKGPYKQGRSVTENERSHVLKVADSNPRYLYFLFMLFCGYRPSEAARIQGMDIKNIEGRNMLHIRGKRRNFLIE